MPFPLYAIGEFRWGGISGLRIIFLVVVHGDGDAPSFIRNRRIPKEEISRLRIIFSVEDSPFIRNRRIPMREITGLRINFPAEVHRDGDAPSLYTQNEDSERGKSQGCV